MHADNDYCRRGRTMMHGGGGSVSQKVYLCGGLYCERRNKIVKRKRRNGIKIYPLFRVERIGIFKSSQRSNSSILIEEIRLTDVINITTCASNA